MKSLEGYRDVRNEFMSLMRRFASKNRVTFMSQGYSHMLIEFNYNQNPYSSTVFNTMYLTEKYKNLAVIRKHKLRVNIPNTLTILGGRIRAREIKNGTIEINLNHLTATTRDVPYDPVLLEMACSFNALI